jgi:FMN hydrolase / 5-amino-6-(5-phospho-D-ribitylamino)uracil phosphatase
MGLEARVILWDVMDTLVVDPFREVMPEFFGLTLNELIRVKHPTAWVRFERAELDEQSFLSTFFKDGRQFDHAAFKARVREAYAWVPGMEDVLRSLAARGVGMHALSNYPCWYTWIDERLGLSRYLSWSFVSCHTGVRKPDRAAYENALAQLECAPEECVFVDDRAQNCEAARAVGMRAIEFSGDAEALERALR